jgi:hypothetical protein
MAIVKHIKSRNANYSAAINYLLFEHDEKTGKKILDESGRSILRKRIMSIEDIARKIILQSVRLIINSRQGYQIR